MYGMEPVSTVESALPYNHGPTDTVPIYRCGVCLSQCWGSGSGIRCHFDPGYGILDPGWVKIQNPDPDPDPG
jgi:hypothetical protein